VAFKPRFDVSTLGEGTRQGLRRVAYAVDDEACAVEVAEIAVRWIGNAPWPVDCRLPAICWRHVRSQCDDEVTH